MGNYCKKIFEVYKPTITFSSRGKVLSVWRGIYNDAGTIYRNNYYLEASPNATLEEAEKNFNKILIEMHESR